MNWPSDLQFFTYFGVWTEDLDFSLSFTQYLDRKAVKWRFSKEDYILIRWPDLMDILAGDEEFQALVGRNEAHIREYFDFIDGPQVRIPNFREYKTVKDSNFTPYFKLNWSSLYSRETHELKVGGSVLGLDDLSWFPTFQGDLKTLYRALAILRIRGLLSYVMHTEVRELLQDKEYYKGIENWAKL